MTTKNTPEKFWSRVAIGTPEECWEWQGTTTSTGYGSVSWSGAICQAHRVAFFLTYGGIPLQTGFRLSGRARRYKHFVLHRCDNRKCCNPGHLFLGSMRANQLDAYKKGRKRQPKSTHSNAKLTREQVLSIRDQYATGETTQTRLAIAHGVSQRVISKVVRNESYKDIVC